MQANDSTWERVWKPHLTQKRVELEIRPTVDKLVETLLGEIASMVYGPGHEQNVDWTMFNAWMNANIVSHPALRQNVDPGQNASRRRQGEGSMRGSDQLDQIMSNPDEDDSFEGGESEEPDAAAKARKEKEEKER